VFWGAGGLAILSSVPLHPWAERRDSLLLGLAALALAFALGHALWKPPLPAWVLHLTVAAATAVLTLLQLVGGPGHADFVPLYVWVGLYSALFFTPRWVVTEVGLLGVAYAAVLATQLAGSAVFSWLVVVGTTAVAAAVVAGLVHQLRRIAVQDPLTGLPNRRVWEWRLPEEIGRAQRSARPLSVAMLDLDEFKQVNDRLGHRAGDRILRELGSAWLASVRRSGDLMVRLGGDEFALMAPETDGLGLERLLARLRSVAPAGAVFSAGAATWDGAESAADLAHRADQAMYRAKAMARVVGEAWPAAPVPPVPSGR